MTNARLRLRVRIKETRETYVVFWPAEYGILLSLKTGVIDVAAGQERNDRGEVVRTFERFMRYVW